VGSCRFVDELKDASAAYGRRSSKLASDPLSVSDTFLLLSK
jgi:hypothetical protein